MLLAVFLCLDSQATTNTTLHVFIEEWKIHADRFQVGAGHLHLSITNQGQQVHDLMIMRTTQRFDILPMKRQGGIDQREAGEVVGHLKGIQPGSKRELQLELKPGYYALVCNRVQYEAGGVQRHYARGMRAPLFVQ